MQSNNTSVAGIAAYQGNTAPSPTISAISRRSSSFTVANGLVQGDHKSPNPISFSRRVQECWSAERTLGVKPQYGGGAAKWWGNDPQVNSNGRVLIEPDQDFLGVGVIRDQALAKIYEELRGNSEVLVDLLEGASTIRMLRASVAVVDGVGKVLDLIAKQARQRRKLGRGQVTLDWVTGKWLEYRYGWIPLVGSFYDAFDNLARVEADEVREIVARSGNRFDRSSRPWLQPSNQYNGCWAEQRHVASERIRLVYRFDLKDRNQLADWTSLNPATIAWELLPLSFVADWFASIGDSLRNLENWWLWKSRFLGGYETYTTKAAIHREVRPQTFVFTPGSSGWNGGYTFETVSGRRSIWTTTKVRSIVTSLPAPRGPRFRVKLGADRLLDAAALFHVLVAKKTRAALNA